MSAALEAARAYLAGGLSVIPVRADGTKKPALPSWKAYQSRLPTEAELEAWFGGGPLGVAVVCGRVSGGLEVLDFDAARSWEEWSALVEAEAPGLLARLPQVLTPSGGRHVYYRTSGVQGNQRLALTPGGDVLIETRGEGGYVVAPGSPAACHAEGREYRPVPGTPALWLAPRLARPVRGGGDS